MALELDTLLSSAVSMQPYVMGEIPVIMSTHNDSLNNSLLSNSTNSTDDEYYYFYDYDDSVNTIPLEELLPVAFVYGLTLLLGVVGNLLVIFSIMRYRRMQNVTNIFLTSLSSADLLLVLICIPIKFAKWFSFTWDFGVVLCKMVHYMQNVSVICSVLTLTTMSMERYYAIIHPMRAKYTCTVKRAKRVIVIVWFLSFTLAIPIIFGQIHKEVGVLRKGYWCLKEWSRPIYSQMYEMGMLLLVLIIPLTIMSFAYISICIELWLVTSARKSMRANNIQSDCEKQNCFVSRGNHVGDRNSVFPPKRKKLVVDDDSTRKQVIKMLVAVIVLFAMCWGPSLIDNVLVAFQLVERYHYGFLKPMRMAFALMAYSNSCVNPIVYAFMSRNFRESFKYALCVCVHGKSYIRQYRYNRQMSTRDTSVTMTRTLSLKTDFESESRLVDGPEKPDEADAAF